MFLTVHDPCWIKNKSFIFTGGVVSPLQAQRQDLIAELKMSRDINGIKKMKVEKVKNDEMTEKQKIDEIAKQLSPDNIIEQVRGYTFA